MHTIHLSEHGFPKSDEQGKAFGLLNEVFCSFFKEVSLSTMSQAWVYRFISGGGSCFSLSILIRVQRTIEHFTARILCFTGRLLSDNSFFKSEVLKPLGSSHACIE